MADLKYVVDSELGEAGLFLVLRALSPRGFLRVADFATLVAANAHCDELNAKARREVRRG